MVRTQRHREDCGMLISRAHGSVNESMTVKVEGTENTETTEQWHCNQYNDSGCS